MCVEPHNTPDAERFRSLRFCLSHFIMSNCLFIGLIVGADPFPTLETNRKDGIFLF